MFKRIIPIILALLFLGACTPYIFGVPEDQWAQMTAEQRQVAMDAYHQQEKIDAERRLAESRRAAEEAKRLRIQLEREAALEAQQDRYQYDAPHTPYPSHTSKPWKYRDTIRVTVEDGEMNFRGKYREFQPVTFRIARGERRALIFRRTGRKSHHTLTVWVQYRNESLYFDMGKRGRHLNHAHRIEYGRRWKSGKKFKHLFLGPQTASQARNISIAVKVLSPQNY